MHKIIQSTGISKCCSTCIYARNDEHGYFCFQCDKLCEIKDEKIDKTEQVNHPTYYKSEKFEVIDIIEDFNLCFCAGNALKYILRAGVKDPLKYEEDLKKAIWYLQRIVDRKE